MLSSYGSHEHVSDTRNLFLDFRKIYIKLKLNYIQKYNEIVAKKRYILLKIIDSKTFCSASEIALRGHNEKSNSEYPGIVHKLINYSSELYNT